MTDQTDPTLPDEVIRGHHRFVREGGKWRLWGAESHPTHPGERGGLVWGPDAVTGAAWVSGRAWVSGAARVSGDARVSDTRHILTVSPIASEDCQATLVRTATGHQLAIGCWTGTTTDLRTMTTGDDWPAARTEAIRALHRPELLALADLCDARIATWGWDQ